MIKLPKNLGAIKSKPDYRSKIVAKALASAIPSQFAPSLPQSLGTQFYQQSGILMQNLTPSCVSHSVVELMKLWWFVKTGKIVSFNPQYLHIKSVYPGADPTSGRDPKTVLACALEFGCCTSATLPIDSDVPLPIYCNPAVITPAMDAEAAQYKIPGYIPIELNQNSFRTAIQTYGAISMMFNVGQEWFTAPDGTTSWAQKDIDPVRAPAVIISGHQITGTGWNSDLEHLVNHWSSEWAENGESDWIWNEWQPFVMEAWAIADVPGSVLETVQGLPAPGEFVYTFTTPLSQGMQSLDVRALQIALSINGETTYPEITGYYGPLTAQAVKLFQEKYSADILAPEGLTAPTGNVGPATLTQLNALFSN